MRVLIAVPIYDFAHFEFIDSLMRLTRRMTRDGIDFDVKIKGNTLVYVARDYLAQQAANNNYDYVLWLDADMVFPDTIFNDLLDNGKKMVTGIYHSRRPPYNSCVFRKINTETVERFDEYPRELFEIDGCGFGIVLMKAQLIRDLFINFHTCFLPEKQLGEDIAFCKRVQMIGEKIYCDPTVRAGHIGHNVIYPEDHDRYLEQIHNPNNIKV